MKAAVIGNGNVGMAVFSMLRNVRGIDEIVLVGRNINIVRGEVDDYLDAQVLDYAPAQKLSSGGYDAVKGADIIIYCAGAARKAGQDRLELAKINSDIARSIFSSIGALCRDSIILCLSNPVDVLTYTIQTVTGISPNRIIGSGTILDTARLRRFIAGIFDVSASSVNAFVIGEHGGSAVILWSGVRIANFDIEQFSKLMIDDDASIKKDMLEKAMKQTGLRLIQKKGSTAYGVASAAARIVSAITNDTKEILPLCTTILERYGCKGCAVSVPCALGKSGILETVPVNMSPDEKAAFENSAECVKNIIAGLDI